MRRKLPIAAFKDIPAFLEQGLSVADIANRIGCTVGTLRVKCSQLGISLRRGRGSRLMAKRDRASRGSSQLRRTGAQETAESAWRRRAVQSFQLRLPRRLIGRLRQRAALAGISEAQLIALLIEVIDRDDLYDAVLDARERD
jgi:transposase-like protein